MTVGRAEMAGPDAVLGQIPRNTAVPAISTLKTLAGMALEMILAVTKTFAVVTKTPVAVTKIMAVVTNGTAAVTKSIGVVTKTSAVIITVPGVVTNTSAVVAPGTAVITKTSAVITKAPAVIAKTVSGTVEIPSSPIAIGNWTSQTTAVGFRVAAFTPACAGR